MLDKKYFFKKGDPIYISISKRKVDSKGFLKNSNEYTTELAYIVDIYPDNSGVSLPELLTKYPNLKIKDNYNTLRRLVSLSGGSFIIARYEDGSHIAIPELWWSTNPRLENRKVPVSGYVTLISKTEFFLNSLVP